MQKDYCYFSHFFILRSLLSFRFIRSLLPFFILLLPKTVLAHEKWVLTTKEIAEWGAKPFPPIFTELSSINLTILVIAIVFLGGWILLGRTGARELFPDLQIRLASYGGVAAFILRIALAITLFTAALGLNPRVGVPYFEAPTLFAPDQELYLIAGDWLWVAWVEALCAFALLFGVYVRVVAVIVIALVILGCYAFGTGMLDYAGFIVGIAIYLLLQGAGSYYLPLPTLLKSNQWIAWLENQPRERAQFLLRMLTGANFLYVGIKYKFLQPNLTLGLVIIHHVPTFGMEPATLVLVMGTVEALAGMLLIAGVLMRPMSIFLFACFIFFVIVLGEGLFSHAFINGILLTFLINASGQWRRPIAKDKPAHIVILGGSFAGIHCAMKLEKLLGVATNVKVTLVHQESYFQFDPLLPEVVGGAVQPGNIANPIRRICPNTHFIQGEVATIDYQTQHVNINLISGQANTVAYDQLVIALNIETHYGSIPGLLEHALPVMNIGDALIIRQRVFDCLEQVEFIKDNEQRQGLLTFAVIGGGLRGTSTAVEIRSLLDTALVSYPHIRADELRVFLFEKDSSIIPQFDSAIANAAHRRLIKLGVRVYTNTAIAAVTPVKIKLSQTETILCQTVICAISARARIITSLPKLAADNRVPVDAFFQAQHLPHIFVVGDGAYLAGKRPFLALTEVKKGRLVANNVWAKTQGYQLRPWIEKHPPVNLAALGRKAAVGKLLGFRVSGVSAWFISRLLCLLTMPGLERNLRILIDWLLDIPFRSDITMLTPKPTAKLGRAHYEIGDEVIRQGEEGHCAYILVSGTVEVCKKTNGQEKRVATLGEGECFGEIALLTNMPRTATVRCLTPIEVIILPRDQLMPLITGFQELGDALRSKMRSRH